MTERKPATSFPCPHCGVKPGIRCVTPGIVWRKPHQARLRLVEKQYDANRHAETIQLLANRGPLKSS